MMQESLIKMAFTEHEENVSEFTTLFSYEGDNEVNCLTHKGLFSLSETYKLQIINSQANKNQ